MTHRPLAALGSRQMVAPRVGLPHMEDVPIILDLGGNDFYTNDAGSGRGPERPFGIVIDFDGDDAYEATTDTAEGTGRLGVGILIDVRGNDSYIGQRWAQGSDPAGDRNGAQQGD